jgi:NAD(P)-dependent dehydrogenase (short-subunit alcohol dehydrogenase family)
MRGLSGKVAIVTGGAQGIGRATVDRLVAEGVRVVVADISDEHGKAVEHELNTDAERVWYANTDIAEEDAVVAMAQGAAERFGGIQLLVNCAATFIMRGVAATPAEWRRIMDVNIMGQALCVKHVLPHLIDGGGGSIVNVASISGHIAQPEYLTYNTTKGAVVNMTRCLALDLGRHNVRVNAVNPGTVWNKNNERYHRDVLGLTREQADRDPEIGGRHILGRTADPDEIASAIAFLLSDEASYITGENLMVDAGYTAV